MSDPVGELIRLGMYERILDEARNDADKRFVIFYTWRTDEEIIKKDLRSFYPVIHFRSYDNDIRDYTIHGRTNNILRCMFVGHPDNIPVNLLWHEFRGATVFTVNTKFHDQKTDPYANVVFLNSHCTPIMIYYDPLCG